MEILEIELLRLNKKIWVLHFGIRILVSERKGSVPVLTWDSG